MSDWQHNTVASNLSAEARVRNVEWNKVQPWCNFVVLRPTELPRDSSINCVTIRPESPPGRPRHLRKDDRPDWHDHNRCCFRFELVAPNRRLRVKEFLYDWAPPAFDHPSLWKSQTSPFPVGQNIGWLGTDFKHKRAASLNAYRTMVEVSVVEGSFSDEELQGLLRGLKPVDEDARSRILATPWATLCYQNRHKESVIAVPCGYFAHTRSPETVELTTFDSGHDLIGLPYPTMIALSEQGYKIDSTFVYGLATEPQEVDCIFERREPPGCYLRLLVSPSTRPDGIKFPPTLDLQPCTSVRRTINGRDVYHAFLCEEYGPHEAVWQDGGRNFMLVTKPRIDTNSRWFGRLIETLVRRDAG